MSAYEMSEIMEQASIQTLSENRAHDYGTGEKYTPVEVHTLGYIADHPGCTVTEIAQAWLKTKGAVSQILKKLRQAGMIDSTVDASDAKRVFLRLTPKGRLLDAMHRRFDEYYWEYALARFHKKYTAQEISDAFTLLKDWAQLRIQLKDEVTYQTVLEGLTRSLHAENAGAAHRGENKE